MARSLLEFSRVRDAEREREREKESRGNGEKGLETRALYFSCVVIKVYYANEIMSASLFYRG